MESADIMQLVADVRESLAQSQLEPLLARLDIELERDDLRPEDRGTLLTTKAIATRHSANLYETTALLVEATDLLKDTGELASLLRAQTAIAGTALAMDRAEDALNYAVDALQLLDQPAIPKSAIPPAASNLGHLFREFAAFELAVQLGELAYRTAREGHSPASLPLAALNLAHAALEGRRLATNVSPEKKAEWLAIAHEACATLIQDGDGQFDTHVLGHGTMAEVALESGDLDAARQHIDLALGSIDVAGTLLASIIHLAHGMVLRREDRSDEAIMALTEAEEGLRDEYLPFTRLLRERSLAYAATGEYRRAHDDSFLLAQLAESRRALQVGQLAGQVLRRAQLEQAQEALTLETQRLTTLARTDGLTGLASRQWFEAHRLNHSFRSAEVGVVLVDLDDFKAVNDVHGHLVGDEVLRTVGRILQATCENLDIVARFGGDEFVALCTSLDEASIVELAEGIRSEVEDHDWSALRSGLRVSASAGCAVGPSYELTDLLSSADRRLYEAKATGRNRVVAHP